MEMGKVSWCEDDVLEEANSQQILLDQDEAKQILKGCEGRLKDAMVEAGWWVIQEAIDEFMKEVRK